MKKLINPVELETIDAEPFEIVSNPFDIHRDLHVFSGYMRECSVKRSVRSNSIPKADIRQMAKMLSVPAEPDQIEESGILPWLKFIDKLALRLDIVHYDTAGVFLGPTSVEPSYPDNYIRFDHQVYTSYMSQPCQKQEQMLFDKLVGEYSYRNNEFVMNSVFGRLDRFPSFGYGAGVMPSLRFDKIRRFLFDCLKSCESGRWYGTDSLIRHLKNQHPFFLIPQHPEYKHKWESEEGRYGNFREGDSSLNVRKTISEDAPDAFERVEGRFVERFLEHVPLLLGYVELAYGDQADPACQPSMGCLRGFKIKDRFLKFMTGKISEPTVTIWPDHEIRVESDIWPASVIEKLALFTDKVVSENAIIFRLNKAKARQFMAGNESQDVAGLLETLSASPLPKDIAAEWSVHAKNNNTPDTTPSDDAAAKSASDHSGLLSPKMVSAESDRSAMNPEEITVRRKTCVTLSFQSQAQLEIFAKALANAACPVETDETNKSLAYDSVHCEKVFAAVKNLEKTYRICIED